MFPLLMQRGQVSLYQKGEVAVEKLLFVCPEGLSGNYSTATYRARVWLVPVDGLGIGEGGLRYNRLEH